MGNEISTIGGSVCIIFTFLGCVVTGFKVVAIKKALYATLKYTKKKFMQTNVRYIGQTLVTLVATIATGLLAALCIGKYDGANEAFLSCGTKLWQSFKKMCSTLASTVSDLIDGIPIIGHIKGGIQHAFGYHTMGDNALRAASRSTCVIGGGVAGFFAGGPAGACVGGVAGGLLGDTIITMIESALNATDTKSWSFCPSGLLAAATCIYNAYNETGKIDADLVIDSVIALITIPVFDALMGKCVATVIEKFFQTKTYRVMSGSDADSAVKKQKLPRGYNQNAASGETCITESVKHHTRKYLPQKVRQQPELNFKTVEIKMKSSTLKQIKQHSKPQQGSAQINRARIRLGQRPYNLITQEKIPASSSKVNINIKGDANLTIFNRGVDSIKVVDPFHVKYNSNFNHQVSRYGMSSLKTSLVGMPKSKK